MKRIITHLKLHQIRKVARIKNFSQTIKVDYDKLTNPECNLSEEIHNAFGRNGLGLIIIKNIPKYENQRKELLKLGFRLSNFKEEYLKTLEKPEAQFNIGWNKGKSYTENDYEYLCASFYARTMHETAKYNEDPTFQNNQKNIWPDETILPNFKKCYTNLGNTMLDCQINMLKHLDKYVLKVFPQYKTDTFYNNFYKQFDSICRLLIYYPPTSLDPQLVKLKGESIKKNWCGWHRDFGIVTGLTHAIYLNQEGKKVNNLKSALLVKDRNKEITDVKFEENEMVIQTGDVAFLLSGGNLISTPHAVKITEGIPDHVYRITFVNFFGPEYEYKIFIPENISQREIFDKDPFNLANMLTKFKQGSSYKELIFSAMKDYYPKI